MFGLLNLKEKCMNSNDQNVVKSHYCGVCNALSARYGLLCRWLTNHDATFYSLLYSAQTHDNVGTQNCPLRFKKTTPTQNKGLIYGSAISMIMAKTKFDDDVLDQNNFRSRFYAKLIDKKMPYVKNDLNSLGFNFKYISSEINRQEVLENHDRYDLCDLISPTENVVSEIFAHTARLSNNEINIEPLSEMGRNVGRLMYLVDSYIDMPEDVANGRFNALTKQENKTNTKKSVHTKIKRLCDKAVRNISNSVDDLELQRHPQIVNESLITSLKQVLEIILHPQLPMQNTLSFPPSLSLGSLLEGSQQKNQGIARIGCGCGAV